MIETLEQWNTRLGYCGCCEMPACPTPVVVCEVKYGSMDRAGTLEGIDYVNDGFEGDFPAFLPAFNVTGASGEEVPVIYRKLNHTQEDITRDVEEGEGILPDTSVCTATTRITTTHLYNGDGTVTVVTNTYVLSEPLTKAEFLALTLAEMEADEWAASTNSGVRVCSALQTMVWAKFPYAWSACGGLAELPISTFGANAFLRKMRRRFRIPNTHTGSYFKITYDLAEFPDVGDPSFISQDNVVEWTGPGTGLSTDPSWLTPWLEIDPPEAPGERRIVNIRYICYAGTRYGSKPQVMGEAIEIPPP